MCGIAGISVATGDTTINTRIVGADLLLSIETRGRDATGAAWLEADGETVALTKVPVTATSFIKHRMEHMPETTATMILHTRTGTHGSSENRLNLHPIVHQRIVGVHNGVLRNHHKLFTAAGSKPTPTATVDSEGLMAILNTDEHPTEVLGQIEGDAAVAWIDLDAPEVLHLACVTGRPLCIGQTKEGSLIFASTALAVRTAAKAGKLELVYEEEVKVATYLKVVAGVIVEYLPIKDVKHSDAAFKAKYAYTSGGDAKPAAAAKGTGYKPNAAKAPAASRKPAGKPTAPKAITAAPATTTAYEDDLAAARRQASAMARDAKVPFSNAPVLVHSS